MQPIHELLNKIRWDLNFTGDFQIAYEDHANPELIRVSVRQMQFTDSRFAFEIVSEEGIVISIPMHRIREVYRDGNLIWKRPKPEDRSL